MTWNKNIFDNKKTKKPKNQKTKKPKNQKPETKNTNPNTNMFLLQIMSTNRFLKDQLNSIQSDLKVELPNRILHGDLFLENTMFDGDKFIAIIDFEV